MHTLLPAIKKEAILLIRDFPGLLILFLMPVLLIFVVTVAQVNVMKNETAGTQILWVDEVNNDFTSALFQNIDSSGFLHPVTSVNKTPVNAGTVSSLVEKGRYQFGIILRENGSQLHLLIDPAVQERQQNAVVNSLNFIIRTTQARLRIREMLTGIPEHVRPAVIQLLEDPGKNNTTITAITAGPDHENVRPGLLQNTLPGFILFAMFFIVIPLSGSMISEKSGGSFIRLKSFPTGLSRLIAGKVIIFLLVCLLQFLIMMLLGLKVFPAWFDYPPLETGPNLAAIAFVTVCAALTAVGFGILTGSFATSHNQAALFGSVMVVMLGVISGTFFPIHLLPEPIRIFSLLSPVRWGIDNYLTIFVRNGSFYQLLPWSGLQLLFFGLAITISIVKFAKWN